jgi:CRP-like cAMP-binding protein
MVGLKLSDEKANFSFFANVSDAARNILLGGSTRKFLLAGQYLFHQDDPADAIYILTSGTLEVSTMSSDGRKLSLNIVRPGEFFGEIALTQNGVRSASICALDDCVLSRLESAQLFDLMRKHPDLSVELLRLVIDRFEWVSRQLEISTFLPLSNRLARRILLLLQKMPTQSSTLNFSQSDLADHTGATREAVAKILAEWKKRGIIETGRGKIIVLDLEGMERLTGAKI